MRDPESGMAALPRFWKNSAILKPTPNRTLWPNFVIIKAGTKICSVNELQSLTILDLPSDPLARGVLHLPME